MRENRKSRQSGKSENLAPLTGSPVLFSAPWPRFPSPPRRSLSLLSSSSAGPSAALHLSCSHLPLFLSALVTPVSLSGYFFLTRWRQAELVSRRPLPAHDPHLHVCRQHRRPSDLVLSETQRKSQIKVTSLDSSCTLGVASHNLWERTKD